MPGRLELFENESIYHVFNKTIDRQRIFASDSFAERFLHVAQYYRSSKSTISYSLLKNFDPDFQETMFHNVSLKKYFKVEILSFCLMPTHYHFLLKQRQQDGIVKFMSDLMNSFTRTSNKMMQRIGPLFLPRFKSVRIKTDELLKHISRYIHLNPYSSGTVNSYHDLFNYKWSSLKPYVSEKPSKLVNTRPILSLFNNNKERYRKFIVDNADYQKSLELVKYTNKL